jgi:nucleotide-binding universal stress UspA family protein
MAIKNILVPIDGSEPAMRAVEFAGELAKGLGAEVELVTVLDLGQLDFFDGMYQTLDQVENWQEKVRTEILEQAQKQLVGVSSKITLLRGPTVKALLSHMRATNPGMVIMGRTGRTAVDRILHGSVSRRLSASSSVPVTLVG